MEVYLSRNHQSCLHLFPLSVGRPGPPSQQPLPHPGGWADDGLKIS